MKLSISSVAALKTKQVHQNGYRGVALLHDPVMGIVALFHVEHSGCRLIGVGDVPTDDLHPELVTLPGLVISDDYSPSDAFGQAEKYMRARANKDSSLKVHPCYPAHLSVRGNRTLN